MKGIFNPETNSIISYGIVYNDKIGENIVEIPEDFEFDSYSYIPNNDGTFNPNGFIKIIDETPQE